MVRHAARGSVAVAIACIAASLAGCATDTPSAGEPTVVAAFYPLEYIATGVAGPDARVVALAKPGVEPHDLELSPAAVRTISSAELVLYLSRFQPAVDDAVASTSAVALDVASVVTLDGEDPHFWLDPTLLAMYADAVGRRLAELDPANADGYTSRAAAVVADLTTLDSDFTAGLASCDRHTIVVSHEAFGYLAARYGLAQIGLAGIDPESAPSPARLREISALVRAQGVTTIFTESLVTARVAEALAADAGVTTAVLDPVESVIVGDDYSAVMGRNLVALGTALGCE